MVSLSNIRNKKANNKGFTIVELLIVIVVIGILALLVITTYQGVQAKARNSKRANDIQVLQTQIEAFYNSGNNFYPNLTDLNSNAWRTTNMKGLDATTLVDPSSNCNATTSTSCVGSSATPVAGQYQYHVTAADGTTSCEGAVGSGADAACAKYTLSAMYEGNYNNSPSTSKTELN